MSLTARPAIQGLASYSAGRGVEVVGRELGPDGPRTLVKLASNEGIHGPLAIAEKAMREAMREARRYPEAGFRSLRVALAEKHNVPVDTVLVGAGLTAIIHHLAVAYLEPGDEVAYCAPTFTAYRLDAIKMGATPVEASLTPSGACDLVALAGVVNSRTKLVYVTNPNNPTGNIVTRSELAAFIEQLPDHILMVLDEAYFEYVENPDYPDGIREFATGGRQVAALRTFSKIYGMAGLRVGYAICPPEVVRACTKVQNPYEVNRIALAVAEASLNDEAELKWRQAENRINRERLVEGLRALDFEPLPSEANFVRVGIADAARVASSLERAGVIVRPLNSMGDPNGIRVTVGSADEIDTFLKTFAKFVAEESAK